MVASSDTNVCSHPPRTRARVRRDNGGYLVSGTEGGQRINELGATSSITIDAPVDEVWKAITTSELIKQWFFGVDTESDWRPGGPLIHRGEWQGKP
jgi:hypothetical protein